MALRGAKQGSGSLEMKRRFADASVLLVQRGEKEVGQVAIGRVLARRRYALQLDEGFSLMPQLEEHPPETESAVCSEGFAAIA